MAFNGFSPPSSFIQLENLRSVKKFDEFSFQLDAGPDGVFLLRTESYAQMSCWVKELDKYIKDRQVI